MIREAFMAFINKLMGDFFWQFMIFLFVIYIVGVCIELSCRIIDTVTLSEKGGIFGGPTISSTNREATTKDVWMVMVWPVTGLWFLCKDIIWLINNGVVNFFMLLIGIQYKNTRMYKWIDRVFG